MCFTASCSIEIKTPPHTHTKTTEKQRSLYIRFVMKTKIGFHKIKNQMSTLHVTCSATIVMSKREFVLMHYCH